MSPLSNYKFLLLSILSWHCGIANADKTPVDFNKNSVASARDTSTGKQFEALIRSRLSDMGYTVQEQIQVGTRPNGGKHLIDLVLQKGGKSFLVSLKWQQASGTAEQKVPYEMICLSEALKQARGTYQAAYLVLGGEGWTLKKFYLSGGLDRHLTLDQPVFLLGEEDFLKAAKAGFLPKK